MLPAQSEPTAAPQNERKTQHCSCVLESPGPFGLGHLPHHFLCSSWSLATSHSATSGPLHLWLPLFAIFIYHERPASSHPSLCSMSPLLSERGISTYDTLIALFTLLLCYPILTEITVLFIISLLVYLFFVSTSRL